MSNSSQILRRQPSNKVRNVRLAVSKLGARLSYDLFADRALIDGLPGHGPTLQDAALDQMWLRIEELFDLSIGLEKFSKIVQDMARANAFHPVRDYLDGLEWDGVPRIEEWLIKHAKAEDSEYVRAVSSLVLKAAVRRVRRPGCKFDEMLVLYNPGQGTDKSSALAALCPVAEWFSDDLPLNVDTKVVIERLSGRWIVEAAELKGLRRGEVEHVKAFLSRQVDRARLAYGRTTTEAPRQSVIVGSTNSEKFLKDATGNRRFWPVTVSGGRWSGWPRSSARATATSSRGRTPSSATRSPSPSSSWAGARKSRRRWRRRSAS